MTKAIAWNKIKAEYLQGVAPKELAEKYKLNIDKLYDRINKSGWAKEKAEMFGNVRNNVQDRIEGLTNLALDTLVEVINNPETESNVKVQASKALLDISGLKSLKQEVSGINPTNIIINNEAVEVDK